LATFASAAADAGERQRLFRPVDWKTTNILSLTGKWNKSASMNPANPDNNPAGANRPQSPPPIRYDFGAMLKANPNLCRTLGIVRADIGWLGLTLCMGVAFGGAFSSAFANIECVNAVDFSIRPSNPALLMGGPLIEFHEQHPLLEKVSQCVPNTDGMEIYDPPVKFGVLIMDQTYVIAGQFALHLQHGDGAGLPEREKQQREAQVQSRLEWMEPFRLTKLTKFATRSLWTRH
jgi:hypothetical protein